MTARRAARAAWPWPWLWLCLAAAASAQGFAGLGSDAGGFRMPDPAARLSFPADHGPHPGFRVEWWYVTANLAGRDGRDYGVQWTLFRSALSPGGRPPPVWMGHAAVTTPAEHHAAERLARGGTGQAGVSAAPFEAWIDEWRMEGIAEGRLAARGREFAYELELSAEGPLVAHGAHGYSVKSADGHASHYYSQPFYRAAGWLDLPSGRVEVAGHAWLDREWSSQPLGAGQSGWDWVSLHLDGGAKLMGFRLRGDGGDFLAGTWIGADGTAAALEPGELAATPLAATRVAGRDVPTTWRVEVPSRGVDVTLSALNPRAWMDLTVAYWEGPVTVGGSHSGRGYLEMTGLE